MVRGAAGRPRRRPRGLARAGAYRLGVVGDLHLEPGPRLEELGFAEGREQLVAALAAGGGDATYRGLVHTGDLGGYSADPGSAACFRTAKDYVRWSALAPPRPPAPAEIPSRPQWGRDSPTSAPSPSLPRSQLDSFGVPYQLILGNHDLEGFDFDTDADNLQAWQDCFGREHFFEQDAGGVLCLGVSTVKFRDAEFSCHEVHVDEAQLAFLEDRLARNAAAAAPKPVFMFTHAPALGSGLKCLDAVHVKNWCAWLNHSTNPAAFVRLAERYPQIRLWFSGHYHLSHEYADSVSVPAGTHCAFVTVGVISRDGHRDGKRQSRLVAGDAARCQVLTLDHGTGETLVDLEVDLTADASAAVRRVRPPTFPDPVVDLAHLEALAAGGGAGAPEVLRPGGGTVLVRRDGMLMEYDAGFGAAVGAVALDLDGRTVRLARDGAEGPAGPAAAVELVGADGAVERVERGPDGTFKRQFQYNKWTQGRVKGSKPWRERQARKQREAAGAAGELAGT